MARARPWNAGGRVRDGVLDGVVIVTDVVREGFLPQDSDVEIDKSITDITIM